MTELVKTVASGWFIHLPFENYEDVGVWINLAQVTVIQEHDNQLIVKFTNNSTITCRNESIDILKAELTRLSRQSPLV